MTKVCAIDEYGMCIGKEVNSAVSDACTAQLSVGIAQMVYR